MKTLLRERREFEENSPPTDPFESTSGRKADGAARDSASSPDSPKRDLPLVSVIIVNYNYGRFLEQAITSVFLQSYDCVECVVIDNGSTDESRDVLTECCRRYPALRVVYLRQNLGQTGGSVEGLKHSYGPFVIFLDADDFLLEECVEIHMYAHLSSRFHVGFTSGDMLQIVNDQVVSSTNEAMSSFIVRQPANRRDVLRPYPGATTQRHAGISFFQIKRGPKKWIWAPTSGNCFRRDVLDLICDGRDLEKLRTQTDLYLAIFVNCISGSILIDTPVFAYRIHDSNSFVARPQLNGVLAFDPKKNGAAADLARRLIVNQLITHIERFVQEPWQSIEFFRSLLLLQAKGIDGKRGYAAKLIASRFNRVRAATGWLLPAVFVGLFAAPRLVRLCLGRHIDEPAGPAAECR